MVKYSKIEFELTKSQLQSMVGFFDAFGEYDNQLKFNKDGLYIITTDMFNARLIELKLLDSALHNYVYDSPKKTIILGLDTCKIHQLIRLDRKLFKFIYDGQQNGYIFVKHGPYLQITHKWALLDPEYFRNRKLTIPDIQPDNYHELNLKETTNIASAFKKIEEISLVSDKNGLTIQPIDDDSIQMVPDTISNTIKVEGSRVMLKRKNLVPILKALKKLKGLKTAQIGIQSDKPLYIHVDYNGFIIDVYLAPVLYNDDNDTERTPVPPESKRPEIEDSDPEIEIKPEINISEPEMPENNDIEPILEFKKLCRTQYRFYVKAFGNPISDPSMAKEFIMLIQTLKDICGKDWSQTSNFEFKRWAKQNKINLKTLSGVTKIPIKSINFSQNINGM